MPRLLLASVVGLLVASTASAQNILLTITGNGGGNRFGSGLDVLGDVDGDGELDLAIGAAGSRELWIVRVGDGSTIAYLSSDKISFGTNVSALGDATGDGLPEILVSAPQATILGAVEGGAAYVLAGDNLSTWLTYENDVELVELGSATGAVGDLDLDGWPDFGLAYGCITSPFGSGCIDLGAGSLRSTQGGQSIGGNSKGATLYLPAGDVDGDGTDEYLSAWSGQSHVGVLGGPLDPLAKTLDFYSQTTIGSVCAGPAADFDGDGIRDYVFSHKTTGLAGTEVIDVRSALPPHSLISFEVPAGFAQHVHAIDGRGDFDRDGVADVLVGLPGVFPGGRVQAWSGADGQLLFTLEDATIGAALGTRVTVLGDLTGDGRPEFAASAPGDGSVPGKVRIVSPLPPAWVDVGSALAGATDIPQLIGIGSMAAGSAGTLRLSHAAPGAATVLVVGFRPIDQPFKGGVLVPAPDVLVAGLVTSQVGTVKLDFVLPAGTPPLIEIWLQMWIVDAGTPHGLSASNGLQATTQG